MHFDKNLDTKTLLDYYYHKYNAQQFIKNDPICIPYKFINDHKNLEIIGWFASILAWGQRKTIINKCEELITRMDGNPYAFILKPEGSHLKRLQGFVHRTFNEEDLLRTVFFLRKVYTQHDGLENLFSKALEKDDHSVEKGLNMFQDIFKEYTGGKTRTLKHISSPQTGSACKRMNMYLRWMVRKEGVDFGIWKSIQTSQLICPCDVHVARVATKLALLKARPINWSAAVDLTHILKMYDSEDPVKYDFALFGMGIEGII